MSVVPFVRYPKLSIRRKGSTWRVKHKDESWPIVIYARDIYFGTGRLLTTMTLDRHDEGRTSPTRILTSNVDLLVAARRKSFAEEASKRLREAGAEGDLAVSITTMIDALLEAISESKTTIDMVALEDVLVPDDLTPKYVVWPIVPHARPGMLVASSGSGKSSLAGLIGLSVSTGIEILPGIEPREEGPVIYIGQEEDAAQMKVRIMMLIRGHQLKIDLKNYHFMKLRGGSLIDSAELIAEAAASIKAKLIIVDSAQATWGSEGDAIRDYASRWFNAVEMLETPTLIIEHPSAQGTKKNDGEGWAAGTTVKRDRAGHVWGVRSTEIPVQDGNPYRYHVKLLDSKRNYVARQPDINYEVLIYRHDWSRFIPADSLNAESVVDATRTFAAMASIMRDPDEAHEEGWTAMELAERLKFKDDRRVRAELNLDQWRQAPWDEGAEVTMHQVEGTGSGRTNPARYSLEVRQPEPVQLSVLPGGADDAVN